MQGEAQRTDRPSKESHNHDRLFPIFLDETNHRLFVGCRNPAKLLVYDYATLLGQLVATIPISHDTDDLFYDAASKCIYVSCGRGTIDVVRQQDANHYSIARRIPTATGARTSLFLPELRILCVAVPHRDGQAAEVLIFRAR